MRNVQWDYALSHGIENFTLGDGVTAFDANNCLLSYPAKPKPAYYAVQSALRHRFRCSRSQH